jgi:hypothetical protein
MKRLLAGAATRLKGLRLTSAVRIATCVVGANAAAALGQHFNHLAADAITDCIGAQIVQSIPLLARISSGVLDPGSIAVQMATAFIGSMLLAILAGALSTLRPRPCSARASASVQGMQGISVG